MALQDLMQLSRTKTLNKKTGVSDERIKAVFSILKQYIAYWREYPDMFVEFLCGNNPENFHLYFYQRLFLRAVMRHRYAYATFPRAFSKSFLSVLVLMLRCILYPNAHLFVTTGGKEQAVGIARDKAEELCKLIPGLKKEIDWTRGQTKSSKNMVEYIFKNGSKLDVIPAQPSSRGKRAIGGLMEECILIDQTLLNEIIIPLMNIDRRLSDGSRNDKETINKSQIYVTTAGWKNSFAYEKLMQILIQQIIEPSEAFVMGGTWRIPVMEKLMKKSQIEELKLDSTYSESSFAREYNSEWSGDSENSFFSVDKIDKHRVLQLPDYEHNKICGKTGYYILGVDVGRLKCTTEVCVIRVMPQTQGASMKALVNIYTYDAEDFEGQAIKIKQLYYRYQAKRIVIDANGMGVGLIDFMTKTQIDPLTGEDLIPFGIVGGTSSDAADNYREIKGAGVEEDAIYLMKANAEINTEAHSYVQAQLFSGKIKFLIDENQAKANLMSTKTGQDMDISSRNDYLQPFVNTTILREQMLNLVQKNNGTNIILNQVSKKVLKDKFSAFEYGMYYIKILDDLSRKKKRGNIADMMLFTKGK